MRLWCRFVACHAFPIANGFLYLRLCQHLKTIPFAVRIEPSVVFHLRVFDLPFVWREATRRPAMIRANKIAFRRVCLICSFVYCPGSSISEFYQLSLTLTGHHSRAAGSDAVHYTCFIGVIVTKCKFRSINLILWPLFTVSGNRLDIICVIHVTFGAADWRLFAARK